MKRDYYGGSTNMPTSPEAYLISSILRDQDYTTAVAHGVTADMFHAFAEEYKWVEAYHMKYRKTPTKVAFRRNFPDFNLKAVNDTAHFVDEVRRTHARFMLTSSMRDVADLIAAGDIDKAVTSMQGSMVSVVSQMGAVQSSDLLTDWQGIYDDVKYRKDQFDLNGRAGIPTGFDTFDERTGGVQAGQSWIVGARLGEGKSQTLVRMATSAMMAGYTVHFAALEMSKVEVMMRFHNFLSGAIGKTIFQSLDLQQGRGFDLKAYREFLRSLKGSVKGQMTVSDNRRIGAVEIAAQVEQHRPDIYFLDYLTLAKTRGDGGWQDIGNLSKDLKIIAGEYKVAMVSAAQLNRAEGIGKEPAGAEALAQSDQIGQDADGVITMKKMSDSVTQMKLVKYRHGPSGWKWWTHIDLPKGQFKEVSYNTAMDLIEKDRERTAREQEMSR